MELSLAQLRGLTDVGAIQAALVELTRAEVQTDDALDQLLTQRQALTKHLAQLDALRPRLNLQLTDVGQVAGIISNTSKLAERTSQKVRQLDVEQSRVQLTIRQVEDIVEFKNCIHGLQESMQTKDYEKAAANVHRYLSFDPSIVDIVFDDVADGVGDREILKSTEAELKDIIRNEFDVAVQGHDDEMIVRFFKLFSLLKLGDEGLTKYGQYLTAQIAAKCEAELHEIRPVPFSDNKSLMQVSPWSPYIECLTHLYENLANVIDAQEPVVETHYSPGQMLPLLDILQKECDRLSALVIKSLNENAGIAKKLHSVKTYTPPVATPSATSAMTSLIGSSASRAPETKAPELDLKEYDRLLQDLATISQRSSLYKRFMHDRLSSQLDIITNFPANTTLSSMQQKLKSLGVDGWLRATGLIRTKQELMAQYVTLEEFFLRRSIEKAIRMDEHDNESITSSCLEDSFFIFKKCVTRAMSAVDVDTLCAILNLVGTSHERDFVDSLRSKLAKIAVSLDTREGRIAFMTTVNNLDIGCEYATKLRRDVADALPRSFDNQLTPTQVQQVESCLSMITEPLDGTAAHIENFITTLYDKSWKTDLTQLLRDVLKDTRQVLTEDDYDSWRASTDTHWSKLLMAEFDKGCRFFKAHLTENTFNRLLQVTITSITREVEKFVVKCQFNALGAMVLDGELRVLISYFSSVTQWSSRDKFARLSQISTLLNLEKVSEVHDYWGPKAGSFTWRLSIAEARQVMALRTDFDADEISRLKL